jgi:hypothetical protein
MLQEVAFQRGRPLLILDANIYDFVKLGNGEILGEIKETFYLESVHKPQFSQKSSFRPRIEYGANSSGNPVLSKPSGCRIKSGMTE